MIAAIASCDLRLLELLRVMAPIGVAEMASQFGVTPTAIRQRLGRLLAEGLVQRESVRHGRGRPRHHYRLTRKGLRLTGSNWPDLALALWQQINALEDLQTRRAVLYRVVRALAATYAHQVRGRTTREKMQALADLLAQRRVPFSVQQNGGIPTLTAHACPYPELSASDPTICGLERLLFSELVGEDLHVSRVGLAQGANCQFQPRLGGDILGPAGSRDRKGG